MEPGWYGEPGNAALERFWDGSQWTPRTRPTGAASTPEKRGLGASGIVGIVVVLVAIAAAGIWYFGIRATSTSVSTPDPETVTCGQWANLAVAQKDKILEHLNSEDDSHVPRDQVDTDCDGLLGGPNDSVSSVVIEQSS